LDFDRGELTCPNRVVMPFQLGGTVRFPAQTCAACPLRARCTTAATGRSVTIHPDERLLVELRQRQLTPHGRAKLRERVAVEHACGESDHVAGRANVWLIDGSARRRPAFSLVHTRKSRAALGTGVKSGRPDHQACSCRSAPSGTIGTDP
jgi:hypothetical protein